MSYTIQLNILTKKALALTKSNAFKVTCIWLTWLICGAAFYATKADLGWRKGLFMAVNVGYSIGWGYPTEKNDQEIWFSIFYVLMGASAVAAALGYFAQAMILKEKNWFEAELNRKEYTTAMKGPNDIPNLLYKSKLWFEWHINKFIPVACWLFWLVCGAIWAREEVDFTVAETLYFAVSSLSTGGLWGLPSGSDDNAYLITAIFAMFGVPLAAFAMAELGAAMVSGSHGDDTEAAISEPVTVSELRMMSRFGLENGDGNVDKSEYIILCMVRLGAANPALITSISERFKLLDHSGDGTLSYKEICGYRDDEEVGGELQSYINDMTRMTARKRPSGRSSVYYDPSTMNTAVVNGFELNPLNSKGQTHQI